MQTVQPSVIARDHTLLGICEAIGEDFGFSPVLLRVALAVGLFLSPIGAFVAYGGLGLLVAFTRFVAPNPSRAIAAEAATDPASAEPVETRDEPELALAA